MAEQSTIYEGGIAIRVKTDLSGLGADMAEVKRYATTASQNTIKLTAQMSYDERLIAQEYNKLVKAAEREAAKAQAVKLRAAVELKPGSISDFRGRAQAELDRNPLVVKVAVEGSGEGRSLRAYYQTAERKAGRSITEQGDRDAIENELGRMRRGADDEARRKRVNQALYGSDLSPAEQEAARAADYQRAGEGVPNRSIRAYQSTLERRYGRSEVEQRRRDAEAGLLRASRRSAPTASSDPNVIGEMIGRDFMDGGQKLKAGAEKATEGMRRGGEGMEKIARVGMALAAAGQIAEGLTAVFSADTTDKRIAAVDQARQSVRAIPVVGNLADTGGNLLYRWGSATVNAFQGRGFESDAGYAERMAEETAKQEARTAKMRAGLQREQATQLRVSGYRDTLAGDDAEQRQRLLAAQKRRLDGIDATNTTEYALAQKANARELEQFDTNVAARSNAALFNADAAGLETSAVRRTMAGDSQGAMDDRIEARRYRMAASFATERAAAQKNADELAEVEKKQQKEVAAFEANAEKERADFKKQRVADTASAIAATQEAALRIQQKGYEADLHAFDAATKAKLDAIDDLEAKQNEAARRAAQREVMVAEQERRAASNTTTLQAGARETELRIQKRYDAAERVAFEDNARRRLEEAQKLSPAEQAATKTAIAAERRALEQQQGERRTDAEAELEARQAMARAQGAGMGQLAGTIGQLAGMKAELRAAPADLRDLIAATQQVELKSMTDQILSPRRYASEWDASREAAGGPGGDAGDEMVRLLGLIAEYTKSASQNNGPPLLN
jgi:hypothetical protein